MILSPKGGIALERYGERVVPSITVGATYDADAIAFLNNIGVKDQNIIRAYCEAVAQLKSVGLWNLIYTWYPLIGGTSLAHSKNAKSFWLNQATFNGSPTHNQNGIMFTVNTQYMDLGFASTSLSQYNNTISFFCNVSGTVAGSNKFDLGGVNSFTTQLHVIGNYAGSTPSSAAANYNNTNPLISLASSSGFTNSYGQGHFVTRATNNRELYRNGGSLVSSSATIGGTVPTANFRLGLVQGGQATLRTYCDVTIFNAGLSSSQVSNHYRIIRQFNKMLNRVV